MTRIQSYGISNSASYMVTGNARCLQVFIHQLAANLNINAVKSNSLLAGSYSSIVDLPPMNYSLVFQSELKYLE